MSSTSEFPWLSKADRSTSFSFLSQPSESIGFRLTTVELVGRATIELNVNVIKVPSCGNKYR